LSAVQQEGEFRFLYEPRGPFLPFHQRTAQFSAMVCHRRAGKTVACVGDLILRALYTKKKRAKFAYIGPFRQQAKETAWEYLKEYTQGFTKGAPRESELRIRLPNDATITIYGADNPDAFRGMYFDGVVVDEFGDCRATLWNEVLLPALVDRNGWAVFIGTPKGKNHFFKMFKRSTEEDGWFSMKLKVSESGLLTGKALEMARQEMTDEAWQQEMECDFEAAVPGTYYAKTITQMEKDGRIGNFAYNPDLPVFAAADIGYSDSTAWWFWQVDEQGPVVIDYEEDSGRPLSFYFDMLEEKPYPIDTIWLPHDAKATSFQTGRTTVEQFIARKLPVKLVPRQKVQHGIDAARKIMTVCRIDQTHCYGGVEALRSYRRQWNEKTQQFADKPLHDWASNGSDAFRYMALVTDDDFVPAEPQEQEPLIKPPEYKLEELFQDREHWRSKVIRL
jgi:phage terminase large subunit